MIDTHIAAFRSAQTNVCHDNKYTAAAKQDVFVLAEQIIKALKSENIIEANRLIDFGIRYTPKVAMCLVGETCKVLKVPTRDYLFKTARVRA